MGAEQDIVVPGWGLASANAEADWDGHYAELLPRVYSFFRYRVGHGAVAEDLTATTFARAWGARHRYRRDLASFKTWVYAIARNVAIDHFRTRRPLVPLAEAEGLAGAPGPEAEAERRSDADRLGRLLQRLPDRERELIALKYGAGLSNREIARTTKLGESNVGTILHRTIAALRSEWFEGDTL